MRTLITAPLVVAGVAALGLLGGLAPAAPVLLAAPKPSASTSTSTSSSTKASTSASSSATGDKSIQPDPTPLVADALFVLSIRFDKGKVSITKVAREKLAKKAAVPRKLGRFAVELYSGPTVVERVRFDFPLIHDDDVAGEAYAKGLDVTIDVRIPDSDRPNKLEIWDRATDKRWKYAYPPKAP